MTVRSSPAALPAVELVEDPDLAIGGWLQEGAVPTGSQLETMGFEHLDAVVTAGAAALMLDKVEHPVPVGASTRPHTVPHTVIKPGIVQEHLQTYGPTVRGFVAAAETLSYIPARPGMLHHVMPSAEQGFRLAVNRYLGGTFGRGAERVNGSDQVPILWAAAGLLVAQAIEQRGMYSGSPVIPLAMAVTEGMEQAWIGKPADIGKYPKAIIDMHANIITVKADLILTERHMLDRALVGVKDDGRRQLAIAAVRERITDMRGRYMSSVLSRNAEAIRAARRVEREKRENEQRRMRDVAAAASERRISEQDGATLYDKALLLTPDTLIRQVHWGLGAGNRADLALRACAALIEQAEAEDPEAINVRSTLSHHEIRLLIGHIFHVHREDLANGTAPPEAALFVDHISPAASVEDGLAINDLKNRLDVAANLHFGQHLHLPVHDSEGKVGTGRIDHIATLRESNPEGRRMLAALRGLYLFELVDRGITTMPQRIAVTDITHMRLRSAYDAIRDVHPRHLPQRAATTVTRINTWAEAQGLQRHHKIDRYIGSLQRAAWGIRNIAARLYPPEKGWK